MKKRHLIIFAILFLYRTHVYSQPFNAGPPISSVNTRYTFNQTPVQVVRLHYSTWDLKWLALDEALDIKTYPEAKLLVSSQDYDLTQDHTRNCHDFVWGPWMSSMYGVVSGTQIEAWWMNDPSQNWKDGSMKAVVSSAGSEEEPTFKDSDLDMLEQNYYDVFVQPVALPVCPINSLDDGIPPVHSAILVDRIKTSKCDEGYSAGIYQSKWGTGGIWQHRWAPGCCPDVYLNTSINYRIFAPAPRIGWDPPYWVDYTAWGEDE